MGPCSPCCPRVTQAGLAAWAERDGIPDPQLPCTAPQQVWGQQLQGNAGLMGPPDSGLPPPPQVPQGYNYRAEVRKLIPQLQVLDELPATHTHLPTSRKLDHDWLVVKEAIKEGSVLDSLLPGLGTDGSCPGPSGWGCPRRGLHPPPPLAPPTGLSEPESRLMSLLSHEPPHPPPPAPSPEPCTPTPRPGHPPCEQSWWGPPQPSSGGKEGQTCPLVALGLGHTDAGWWGALLRGHGSAGGILGGRLAWALMTSDFDCCAGSPHGSPVWRRSPELGSPETQRRAPRPWPRSLLVPGGPLPAGLLPQGPAPEDDASSLTHGRRPTSA